MSRDELLAELGRRPGAKGSSNSWASWEKIAAAACAGCGERVTLKDHSVSVFPDAVFHAACWPVRDVSL